MGASVEVKKFHHLMQVEPGKNGVDKGAWARKGELWIVDCAFQLLGQRQSIDMWRYLRPGNFEQLVKMVERMHEMCVEMIPEVFTVDLLERNVAQIWAFETAYKCPDEATSNRGIVGMTEAEAMVAYFDQWVAFTYYHLSAEVTAYKTDASLTMDFPTMEFYLGELGEKNADPDFLKLLPVQKARVLEAQQRLLEMKKGDSLVGQQKVGFRRVRKAGSANVKTFSSGFWGKAIREREAGVSGASVDPSDKRDPDPDGKGGGKGGKGGKNKDGKGGKGGRGKCFQFEQKGSCNWGVDCRFQHGGSPAEKQLDEAEGNRQLAADSVFDVKQNTESERHEVWSPKGTYDGKKAPGGWGGLGVANGGFYGHEVTEHDGSKVFVEADYGEQSGEQTRPAYYRGPRGDGTFDYNKEDIDLAKFGRPPKQVGLDKAEMKHLRALLCAQCGHRPRKLANDKQGPNGTDSRPWACLWNLTQSLHPNCTEVPGCIHKENCYSAHINGKTKAKVSSWKSDLSDSELELAIRKCMPRYEAYMVTILASGFGYMSQHRLGGPGSTPPRMVGQEGDTGYPAGADNVDRKTIKRSYRDATPCDPPARVMGAHHQSFKREREERVEKCRRGSLDAPTWGESWKNVNLDHMYDSGESDEGQRQWLQDWAFSQTGTDGDMTGMPELVSDDDSSSDGSDVEATKGPRAPNLDQPNRRRKYGERFQVWAAGLGITDIPKMVLSLQKQAGTGGYNITEDDGGNSSEEGGVADWPYVVPMLDVDGTGVDSYPQKPPPRKMAQKSMTVGGEKFAASREEVLGRERSVFHRTRDSEPWVGEATTFEGAPREVYKGPSAVTTFSDLYPKGMTVTEANGPWVQRILRQKGVTSVYWTGTDVQHQVEEWERLNAYDLKMELQLEGAGQGGQHRKRCATLILRQEDLLGGGAIIWDLRTYQRRRKARLAPERGVLDPNRPMKNQRFD
jgi:hypothetical protein